jgi:endoglucanase Acf2
LAHIAHALGKDAVRDRLISALKERLATWFDGEAPRYFYYDKKWRSLMAFPDSYGSASHLNDHHFHYGYFVLAAATIARFDPEWAKTNAPMVDLMIRDVAAIDENDEMFPRLRHMDPYAGHSWANGPAQFYEGNNEESSSEDINFSYAVALWGALTKNKKLEDLGLYLYATQVSAVEEYWFDTENRVFPEKFGHPTIAMVWGSGGKYDTWFDQDPGIIHGINFLPITGGSYYLGRHPDYVRKNFQTILDRSYGEVTTWRDPILMFAALGDPEDTWSRYKKDRLFDPEFGASRTMTRLWLASLRHFGLPIFSDSPPSPYAIAFKKDETTTRVAFDPKTKEMTQSVDK